MVSTKKTVAQPAKASPVRKPASPKVAKTTSTSAPVAHAVGRRKKAVSRAWIRRSGSGKIIVNGRDYMTYFDTDVMRWSAAKPFQVIPEAKMYDVEANVIGGGLCAQADAVKLSIARALLTLDEGIRSELRKNGLLTVDERQKERKKYGQKGARRKFQFVKR